MRNASLLICTAVLLTLLTGKAHAQDTPGFVNQASFTYAGPDGQPVRALLTTQTVLVDPRGQVRGPDGTLLPDYAGWTVGLYEASSADPAHADLRGLVSLSPTGGEAGSGLPVGVAPNAANANPFPLTNAGQGMFSFLLDPAQGQWTPGRAFILLVSPPPGSAYRPRRILLIVGARINGMQTFTATALDGSPVSNPDGRMTVTRTLPVQDAAQGSLSLAALNLFLTVDAARPVQITKVGDRAAAQPGDTVVYRVAVRNGGTLPLTNVMVTDTLPPGFDLRTNSVRARTDDGPVALHTRRTGNVATFALPPGVLLPAGQTLSVAYAVLLTPSALRGTGRNSASVAAQTVLTRTDGQTVTGPVADGPAVYDVQVRQGLLSDTGTLVGRVFLDYSEDGEQQRGEPGLPNVSVLLDDSTLVTTDAEGLFSVPTLLPGWHTATLDFRTAPGYVLAPNHRFLERRSAARLVHLEPGGLARVSFGLLPRKGH